MNTGTSVGIALACGSYLMFQLVKWVIGKMPSHPIEQPPQSLGLVLMRLHYEGVIADD